MNPVSDGSLYQNSAVEPDVGRRADALFGGIGLTSLLLAALINLATYAPPLQDFNEWVYQGYLVKALFLGANVPVVLKNWPVPNVVTELSIAGLTSVFTPIVAARIFATLYLASSGAVMWLASQRSDKSLDGLKFLLLICLAIIHPPYWTGETNYQVGLALLVFYFFYSNRRESENVWFDIVYSLLLFACHAMCLAVFLVYVGWRSIFRRRIMYGVATVLPVVALLAWYALLDPRKDFDPGSVPHFSGIADYVSYRAYVLAKVGPYQNLVFDNTSDFDRFRPIFWIGVAVNFLMGACMGLFFAIWVVRSLARRAISPELLTGIVCGLVAILNPAGILGISNVGERFLYPALIFAVLSFDGASILRRFAGCLSAFQVVVLLYILVTIPKGALTGEIPASEAINHPGARYQLLFWHRPFMFLPQIEAAQAAATSGAPPTSPIAFEGSILLARHSELPELSEPEHGR